MDNALGVAHCTTQVLEIPDIANDHFEIALGIVVFNRLDFVVVDDRVQHGHCYICSQQAAHNAFPCGMRLV
jgi:hypothetical protein